MNTGYSVQLAGLRVGPAMMDTDKTVKTASVQPENVRKAFGQSFIGCVIDGSAESADYINRETVDFAEGYGFKVDVSEMDESDEDYGHNISPYPQNVTVKGDNVFRDGKYLGYVDRIKNWGTDFLARTEDDRPNKYFATKTEAVKYIAGV